MATTLIPFASKTIGSGLVLFAGFLLGNFAARNIENQVAELKNLEKALAHLSAQISYALCPLPAALKKAGQMGGGDVGRVLSSMGDLTGLRRGKTPPEALEDVLTRVEKGRLPPMAERVLREVSLGLGVTGHKEQVRYIEGFIHELERERLNMEEEARKKAKLYRYLAVLSALSAIILFI